YERMRPEVRSIMATPITPSNLSAMSRTRVSSFFQSKSPPVSLEAGLGFCWAKAFIATTRAIANATSLMCSMFAAAQLRSPARFCNAATPCLRHNCKYTGRKTGAAFRFWKTDHDQGAGFRDLVEIREQLDLIMVRAQDVGFQRVIVFARGEPGIGVGGLVACGSDLAILIEVFQYRQAPAGVMRDAVRIFVLHSCGVRPAF